MPLWPMIFMLPAAIGTFVLAVGLARVVANMLYPNPIQVSEAQSEWLPPPQDSKQILPGAAAAWSVIVLLCTVVTALKSYHIHSWTQFYEYIALGALAGIFGMPLVVMAKMLVELTYQGVIGLADKLSGKASA